MRSLYKAAQTRSETATIQAATMAWVNSYSAGEPDKIVTFYAAGARLMPPGAPAVWFLF